MQVYIGRIPDEVFLVLIFAAVAAGLWRGGRDGTVMAFVLLVHFGLAWGIEGMMPRWLAVTEDLATLAVCLALVLSGRSYWTIAAAASQVLTATTHVLWFTIGLTPWAYYSAQRAWFLTLIGAVAIGSLLTPAAPSGPSPVRRR